MTLNTSIFASAAVPPHRFFRRFITLSFCRGSYPSPAQIRRLQPCCITKLWWQLLGVWSGHPRKLIGHPIAFGGEVAHFKVPVSTCFSPGQFPRDGKQRAAPLHAQGHLQSPRVIPKDVQLFVGELVPPKPKEPRGP